MSKDLESRMLLGAIGLWRGVQRQEVQSRVWQQEEWKSTAPSPAYLTLLQIADGVSGKYVYSLSLCSVASFLQVLFSLPH